MGPKASNLQPSQDSLEKLKLSAYFSAQRSKKKQILSNMIKRVLTVNRSLNLLHRLPEAAVLTILEFIPNEIKTLIAISPYFYLKVNEAVDSAFSSIESGFAIMHSHLITFKKSSLYHKRIKASGKEGLRIDRVLVAEILPILKNYTVKLRYNYKYHKSDVAYTAEFKIDCIEKGKRRPWCHRDESRFHGADFIRAYCQQIPSVCISDNIELAINWFSLYGLLRLDSIIWQPPIIENSATLLKSLSPSSPDQEESARKKTHLFKISRNCEPEVNSSEWYDTKYYEPPKQANPYDHFLPFLRLVKFEFTGSEIIVSKSTYRAECVGVVPQSVNYVGIWVEVVEEGCEVKQEVKRLGLLYDRHIPVRLRVGDEFVIYISRGG